MKDHSYQYTTSYFGQKKVQHKLTLPITKMQYLTTSKRKQYCPKTSSSYPLLGIDTQQLHKERNSSNPDTSVNSSHGKIQPHLPQTDLHKYDYNNGKKLRDNLYAISTAQYKYWKKLRDNLYDTSTMKNKYSNLIRSNIKFSISFTESTNIEKV